MEDCNIHTFLNDLDCKDQWQLSIDMQVAVGHLLCIADFQCCLYYVLLQVSHFFLSLGQRPSNWRAFSLHLKNLFRCTLVLDELCI